MKITSLEIANVKRVVAVHIDPKGNLVEITGRNGQGKTSVLDSIWWAIAGAEHVQAMPIRTGAHKASIILKLKGDGRELVVTRKFARKPDGDVTTALTVETPDGARFNKGQTMLDELLGELSFDPLAFSRMKPREQFDELRGFVPGVDFDRIDGLNKKDFERRTEVKKEAARARAAAEMIFVPDDTPAEPIDEIALTTELQAAGTLNADIERRTARRQRAAEDVITWHRQAEEKARTEEVEAQKVRDRYAAERSGIEQQIAALKRQLDTLTERESNEIHELGERICAEVRDLHNKGNDLQKELDNAEPLPAVVDTKALAERINAARITNANVEKARQKAVHTNTAQKYDDEAEGLTAAIEARTAEKQKAIAAAQMPVPGLGFGDGIVLLDGVPFEQASDAQRLRTSIAIAMAANPKLRVIRVRDGSLLDDEAMRVLGEMCDAHDFQCWIERVGTDGNGFVIEDGHVKTADTAERAA